MNQSKLSQQVKKTNKTKSVKKVPSQTEKKTVPSVAKASVAKEPIVKEPVAKEPVAQENNANDESSKVVKKKANPKSKIIGSFFEPNKIVKRLQETIAKNMQQYYFEETRRLYPQINSLNDEIELEVAKKREAPKRASVTGITKIKTSKKKAPPKVEKNVVRDGVTYKIITAADYLKSLYPKIKGECSTAVCVFLDSLIDSIVSGVKKVNSTGSKQVSRHMVEQAVFADSLFSYIGNILSQSYDSNDLTCTNLYTDKQLKEYINSRLKGDNEHLFFDISAEALDYVKYLTNKLLNDINYSIIHIYLPNKIKTLTKNIVISVIHLICRDSRGKDRKETLLQNIDDAVSRLQAHTSGKGEEAKEKEILAEQEKPDGGDKEKLKKLNIEKKIKSLQREKEEEKLKKTQESKDRIKQIDSELLILRPKKTGPIKKKEQPNPETPKVDLEKEKQLEKENMDKLNKIKEVNTSDEKRRLEIEKTKKELKPEKVDKQLSEFDEEEIGEEVNDDDGSDEENAESDDQ